MLKIKILWGEDLWNAEWQNKSFKDEMSALQFVRMHRKKIFGINHQMFNNSCNLISHFELIDAIRSMQ